MLAIEILEFCNFRCYFCKAKDITQPKFMSLDLFKRIIIEAKELGIKLDCFTSDKLGF
jgi:molybdenum cofactor biosynthesis enzyme MoaA